jgi:DNA-binding MarR family transcriptional regulator
MAIDDDIKDIRNDLERVKQDIDSINRTQVMINSVQIIQDVRNIVGKSRHMVAALVLTREKISAGDLAERLDIELNNLNKVVNKLHERGLLYREKDGKAVIYRRATRLDLIGFDDDPEIKSIYAAWQKENHS